MITCPCGLRRADLFGARPLEGPRGVGVIFDKTPPGTGSSFDSASPELGGHAVVRRRHHQPPAGDGTIEDAARVLSRFVEAIVRRTLRT